jgi:hypothetical protein
MQKRVKNRNPTVTFACSIRIHKDCSDGIGVLLGDRWEEYPGAFRV